MTDFLIRPVSRELLEQLQSGLASLNGNPVSTVLADAKPGFPCRLSLQDAEPGEELFLVSHCPFNSANPYRETGPVFIRKKAQTAKLAINQLPEIVRSRQVVVRAYDAAGTLIDAEPSPGDEAAFIIQQFLANPGVEFVHIRAAITGCFLCEARRP